MELSRYTFLLILTLLGSMSYAQFRFEQPREYTFENETPVGSQILDIVQDQHGFVWMASLNGLIKFDGSHYEIYQQNDSSKIVLPNSQIHDLFFDDEDNDLYVGTQTGITIFNTDTEQCQTIFTGVLPDGIPNGNIRTLFKDQANRIWIGLNRGDLYQLVPETKKIFKPELKGLSFDLDSFLNVNSVLCINQSVDNKDILWVGTFSGLLEVNLISKQVRLLQYPAKSEHEIMYANRVESIHLTEQYLYYGTWYTGVYRLDLSTDEIREQNIFHDKARRFVSGFYPDENNIFWINTSKGCILYDPDKNLILEQYENNFEHRQYFSVDYIDRSGGIWTIPSGPGIFNYPKVLQQYDFIQFHTSTVNNKPISRDIHFDENRNKYYIAAQYGDGLYEYNPIDKKIKIIPIQGRTEKKPISTLKIHELENEELLVVSGDKFYSLDKNRESLIPFRFQIPNGRTFFNLIEDDQDWLWISTMRNGIYRFNPKNGQYKHYLNELATPDEPRNYFNMQALLKDTFGNIWMETWSGFCIWHASADSLIHFTFHDDFGNVAHHRVGNFSNGENGRVWIGADKIYYMDGIHDVPHELGSPNLVNTKKFLAIPTSTNKLWTTGNHGVEIIDLNDESSNFISFSYIKNLYLRTIKKLSNEKMALLERGWVSILYPEKLQINNALPVPYLTDFKTFDHSISNDSVLINIEQLNLSYKQNFFTLEFSSIDHSMPQDVKYKYRLVGFDDHWVSAEDRRYVSYTNVPGGDYTFELIAINNEGKSSGEPLQLDIFVSNPFWKTNWFYGLFALGIFLFTNWIYRIRIRRVRKEEEVKRDFEQKLAQVEMSALRAQMNPHFIFNSLSSIDYYITKNEAEVASDYLNRFSRLIRLILENSRSEYISLHDELESLRLYIEIESLRYKNKFDYIVNIESGLNPGGLIIPPMLIQPYVENAIWHGLMQKKQKGRLMIAITRSENQLCCVIEDNGIGRDAAAKLRSKTGSLHKSYGMKITRDRLEMINKERSSKASVEVIDLRDSKGVGIGTRVILKIPI